MDEATIENLETTDLPEVETGPLCRRRIPWPRPWRLPSGSSPTPSATRRPSSGAASTYRYAGLDDLLAVVRPVLAEHGVAFVQTLDMIGDQVVLRTRLWVEEGEEVQSIYPMQWTGTHHDRGSEITYARRYSLEAIVGVSGTEDTTKKRAGGNSGGTTGARGEETGRRPAASSTTVTTPRAREPHPTYAKDRSRFCAKLHDHGTNYEQVAGACQAKGWSAPATWPQAKRDGLLQAFEAGTAWADLGLRRPATADPTVQLAS